jgi:hypothetical protein
VPFFPQDRYQCGPAALATVLAGSGVPVTPDELVSQVYIPGRHGSFQVELKAAARAHGRLAYVLPPGLEALTREVGAGRPVLVLQNLAFGWAPRWHYAVVVGFEPERQRVILRSGRTARRLESYASFDRTWSLAGRWAMVILAPGELPADGRPDAYLHSLLEAADALTPDQLTLGIQAGLAEWPDDPDLTFAAANQARAAGASARAGELYRRTLALAPDHAGALNNYADLLAAEGCYASALDRIGQGLALLGPDSALTAVLEQTRSEIIQAGGPIPDNGAGCP